MESKQSTIQNVGNCLLLIEKVMFKLKNYIAYTTLNYGAAAAALAFLYLSFKLSAYQDAIFRSLVTLLASVWMSAISLDVVKLHKVRRFKKTINGHMHKLSSENDNQDNDYELKVMDDNRAAINYMLYAKLIVKVKKDE